MRILIRYYAPLIILISLSMPVVAQNRLLTNDDIYDPIKRTKFSGEPITYLKWLMDGERYLIRGTDPKSGVSQVLKVSAPTGEQVPLFDLSKVEGSLLKISGINMQDVRKILTSGKFQLSPSEDALIFNIGNDLTYCRLDGEDCKKLTSNIQEEDIEEFSPDGRYVSFIRNNDLYIIEVASGRERRLTFDGGPKVLNGILDWVYQEELYGRGNFKSYWWSPDSSRIAFLKLDESKVKDFTIVDQISREQDVETSPYPKAGDPNPDVQLRIVSTSGLANVTVDLRKYADTGYLIPRVTWTPDNKKVAYQIQNRQQSWLDLNLADAATGETATVFRETTKAWVEALSDPHWLNDGSFIWESERDGWRHLYHYSSDGKLIKQVTNGKWEVQSYLGDDYSKGVLFFSASEHSPIAGHTYRINLDGSGLVRLTSQEGSHMSEFSPLMSYFFDYWSDVNTPQQIRLHSIDGTQLRVIDENRVYALKLYKLGKVDFLQVKTRDGFPMEAMIIKPTDFNPKKKYPVMCFTYSGPHFQSVRNSWGGTSYMWNQMLAQKGYIIWICDNRTASGKGAESAWPVYRNFGELELRDLEDGISWLKSERYVDANRIGIWGRSFGGFMTSYALTHSKTFKIGIADGSVTDWSLYDSIYTERFMDLPKNNPQGYQRSAPVNAAKDLSGKLLLIHGMMDDNVHMQNTIQFAYELQKNNKQFRMMLYPRSKHGVVDPYLVKQMRSMMAGFILENL